MSYSQEKLVTNLELIPRHFVVPQVIEKRKGLSANARRAGWVGCNLRLTEIPIAAIIRYVWDGRVVRPENVSAQWGKNVFVEQASLKMRGWLVTTMTLIERLGKTVFKLKELFEFVPHLRDTFPGNRNIEAKLRQQLQILRDQGWLTFLGNGIYARTEVMTSWKPVRDRRGSLELIRDPRLCMVEREPRPMETPPFISPASLRGTRRETNTQSARHLKHGIKARLCARSESLVQTFASQP